MRMPLVLQVGLVVLCFSWSGMDVAAQSTDVTVAIVPRAVASPNDVAAALPDSLTQFPQGHMVVEVWAQTLAPEGLVQVSVDFSYPANSFTVTSVTHSSIFSLFTVDTLDTINGIVDDLSGSVPPAVPACSGQVGAAPQWARVAIIDMQAFADGPADLVVGPANNVVFVVANCGSITPPPVTFVSASITVGSTGAPIPTVSSWGLLVMTLLSLIAGSIQIRRKCTVGVVT